nr:DUF58 domain-containing protein [Actinorhabdospora filicis]
MWAPTRALRRAVAVAATAAGLGVLFGRLDLVVVAVPFIVGLSIALLKRPTRPPTVRLDIERAINAEGGDVDARLMVFNPEDTEYSSLVTRTAVPRWIKARHGYGTYAATVAPNTATVVQIGGSVERWGEHPIGPAHVMAYACDNLLQCRPVAAPMQQVRAYPVSEPFTADDAMPRAGGLSGAHRSRRPGEGGELAGVRHYQPGDRLRRIDWRVSLRTRELHVNHTLSDRDAEVVLLLDMGADAGESGGVKGASSVLDTTVRATASIADHYLSRGDRVSCVEYGGRIRRLRAGGGRRHYLAILDWLLGVRVWQGSGDEERLLRTGGLPSNALVVMLTPLLDDSAVAALATMARSGRFVVVVDTLPPDVRPPHDTPWSPIAERLWRLDRENVVAELREHGVPVVPWTGTGSLDQVLRDVTRMSAARGAVI